MRFIYNCIVPFLNFVFHKQIFGVIIFIILLIPEMHIFANNNDNDLYDKIITNDTPETLSNCRKFIKKYPNSSHNLEVRRIIAEKTHDPSESVKQYKYICDYSKSLSAKCSSFEALLELYFLTSQYEKMSINKFTELNKNNKMKYLVHYFIKSEIITFDYENAKYLFESYNTYLTESCNNVLSQILFYKTGLKSSKPMPDKISASQLYFIAKEYYSERKYEYAFSAYSDLQSSYKKSPEAIICKNRFISMKENNYKYTDKYLSNYNELKTIDSLTPEVADNKENSLITYSVVFGPFLLLDDVKSLRNELKNDYDVTIIKKISGYFLYAGNEKSVEQANTLKIRLAEEFGLNGKIVQKIEENGREYIYGD